MREVLGSFVGRQLLDHSVFAVLAFKGNIVFALRSICKKIMIRVMIVVINIVFFKKIAFLPFLNICVLILATIFYNLNLATM